MYLKSLKKIVNIGPVSGLMLNVHQCRKKIGNKLGNEQNIEEIITYNNSRKK